MTNLPDEVGGGQGCRQDAAGRLRTFQGAARAFYFTADESEAIARRRSAMETGLTM